FCHERTRGKKRVELLSDALEHLFQLIGAGLDGAVEAAPGDLDGHDRGHAIGEADHRSGDATGITDFIFAIEFHANGEWIEETVRDQDPEKGADERGGDVMTDL